MFETPYEHRRAGVLFPLGKIHSQFHAQAWYLSILVLFAKCISSSNLWFIHIFCGILSVASGLPVILHHRPLPSSQCNSSNSREKCYYLVALGHLISYFNATANSIRRVNRYDSNPPPPACGWLTRMEISPGPNECIQWPYLRGQLSEVSAMFVK